jgi:hypothetical protein
MSDFFDETCGTCIWFRKNESEKEGAENMQIGGTCWRYPPTPLSLPVPAQSPIQVPKSRQGAAQAASQGIMTLPVRPPTGPDTLACGEWESLEDDGEGDEKGPASDAA